MLGEMLYTEAHHDQAILCNGIESVDVFLLYRPIQQNEYKVKLKLIDFIRYFKLAS